MKKIKVKKNYMSELFNDEHFDFIEELIKSKESELNNIEDYKNSQEKLYKTISQLQELLEKNNNVEELQLFDTILKLSNREEKYLTMLTFSLGIKTMTIINNL